MAGEPSDLVVEALLRGTGDFVVFPKGKEPFNALAYSLGHLLEALDCRCFGLFAPQPEGRSSSSGVYAVGKFVDVAQVFLHK